MSALHKTVVTIPVRNEAGLIGTCLQSLMAQSLSPVQIILFLNNCTDESLEICLAAQQKMPNIEIVERQLQGASASAGEARRLALDYALAVAGNGVILTTDADTIHEPDWIAKNLTEIRKGADAVCGKPVMLEDSRAFKHHRLNFDESREALLLQLQDEMTSLIDPDPSDPWPRHQHESGASIAVRASVLRSTGGAPNVATGEDRALIAKLQLFDAKIRHSPAIATGVSGRLEGRAAGGMAETIRRRLQSQDMYTDDKLEPTVDIFRRINARARLRAVRNGTGNGVSFAKDLLISQGILTNARQAKCFGTAWASVQAMSPVLHRRRVSFADLARETRQALVFTAELRAAGPPQCINGAYLPSAIFANDAEMSAEQKILLEKVAAMLPALQQEAACLDADVAFPKQSFNRLRDAGILRSTLSKALGGYGFGIGTDGAAALLNLFLLLGEGSLPVARLYEAHVNALQLISRYGSEALVQRCASDALRGEIFALWVTDPPENGLRLQPLSGGFLLTGGKDFCSGAGVATRALVTAASHTGIRMLVVSLEADTRVLPSNIKLSGMRAAITGSVGFSGMQISADALLGQDGDYLREPVFSAGAWRGSAGALGGLTALVKIHRAEMLQRRRADDPHQQARFGQLVIAHETSRLWMAQAALRGCLEDDTSDAIVAYINLARLAVESACLDGMRLTQRALGLSIFIAGHPAERICRDLAAYLRQPAPDETLVKAAQYYFRAELPAQNEESLKYTQ